MESPFIFIKMRGKKKKKKKPCENSLFYWLKNFISFEKNLECYMAKLQGKKGLGTHLAQ